MNETMIPQHIGYIMDGNRRWAKAHGLPPYEGHLAGYNTLKDVLTATIEGGVKYATLYAFSSENWQRQADEVEKLMGLMVSAVKNDRQFLAERNVRVRVLGRREGLSEKVVEAIERVEYDTAANAAGTLALCFNYGGHLEITDAVKKIVQSGVGVDEVTPELIAQNIYAPDVPPCDLIVRTSGEQRLSNFMLWRAAYSELLFVDKHWPEMTKDDVRAILEEYANRNRRFGG